VGPASRYLIVALVCGCNPLFGLEPTDLRPDPDARDPDRDNDGIADKSDNCIDAANADQQDTDDDGAGDACDGCEFCAPCTVPPSHDDDRDKIADGCDSCPGLPNSDQANGDGDQLGDVCDPDPNRPQRRFLFDGFGVLDSTQWLEGGARWTVTDDRVGPNPSPTQSPYLLQRSGFALASGTGWSIEVAVQPPARGSTVGLVVVGAGAGVNNCLLTNLPSQGYRLVSSSTMGGIFAIPSQTSTVRLRMTAVGVAGQQDLTCEVVGLSTVPQGFTHGVNYPLTLQLFTQVVGPQFQNIDVIGD
jgi:hypothetical protein